MIRQVLLIEWVGVEVLPFYVLTYISPVSIHFSVISVR